MLNRQIEKQDKIGELENGNPAINNMDVGRDRASHSSYGSEKRRGTTDLPMTTNNSTFYFFFSYQAITWNIVPSPKSNRFMDYIEKWTELQ